MDTTLIEQNLEYVGIQRARLADDAPLFAEVVALDPPHPPEALEVE
jgi:hypothetical protein